MRKAYGIKLPLAALAVLGISACANMNNEDRALLDSAVQDARDAASSAEASAASAAEAARSAEDAAEDAQEASERSEAVYNRTLRKQ